MQNFLNADLGFDSACGCPKSPPENYVPTNIQNAAKTQQSPYVFTDGVNSFMNACNPDVLPTGVTETAYLNGRELHRKWVWVDGKKVLIENIEDIEFLEP